MWYRCLGWIFIVLLSTSVPPTPPSVALARLRLLRLLPGVGLESAALFAAGGRARPLLLLARRRRRRFKRRSWGRAPFWSELLAAEVVAKGRSGEAENERVGAAVKPHREEVKTNILF